MRYLNRTLLAIFTLAACNNDDDAGTTEEQKFTVEFSFTHNWDGSIITDPDFDLIQYINANGEQLSISKIVYLISDITFTNAAGEVFDAGDFNLVNVRENINLSFTPNIEIPAGDYTVTFTFGFDDEDNIDLAYPELNSADGGWNVPLPMGGGYHYMRLEGKYINTASDEIGYQYHTIRANDMSTNPITLQDTSFEVNLGLVTIGSSTNIEVKMNVDEWFKNPNLWDLNVLFMTLMPNFDAQIMMSENGATVFTKGAVTQ